MARWVCNSVPLKAMGRVSATSIGHCWDFETHSLIRLRRCRPPSLSVVQSAPHPMATRRQRQHTPEITTAYLPLRELLEIETSSKIEPRISSGRLLVGAMGLQSARMVADIAASKVTSAYTSGHMRSTCSSARLKRTAGYEVHDTVGYWVRMRSSVQAQRVQMQ